ncbi:O-antigen polymerase [Enterococcus florum]|nr:O-antigen polymerase [Enterococcus florum]
MEMSLINKNEKYEIRSIELFCFIFSMIFLGEIKGIDIRIIVYIFWIIYSLIKRINGKIFFTKRQLIVIILLSVVLLYSSLVFLFSLSNDFFFLLKTIRSIVSALVIFLFFNNSNVSYIKLTKIYLLAISIHALSIILSILSPSIRESLYIFSGYSKKLLPFRSSGLFSGYDFAGYFINIAIFFFGLLIIWKKTRNSLFVYCYFIFLILAVILTSRFNVFVLAMNVLFLLFISYRNNNLSARIFFTIINGFLAFFLAIFSVLSMNIAPNLRFFLATRYPLLNNISTTITDSYANYDVSSTISSQFVFPSSPRFFFGLNERAPVDPGYINIIYYAGLIGLILIILIYVFLIKSSLKEADNRLRIFLMLLLLMNLVFEIKLSFLLSSGAFELLVIFTCAKNEIVT